MKVMNMTHVDFRNANFVNKFYPDEPELSKMLNEFYLKAEKEDEKLGKEIKDVKIAIAPHAGYTFSGDVAMLSHYFLLKDANEPKTVVILSPSHTGLGSGYSLQDIVTPLGKIENKTIQLNEFYENEDAHFYEHAAEVQLPFIQYLSEKKEIVFKFFPIIIQEPKYFQDVLHLVKLAIEGKIKLIISSDFVHFGYSYGFVPFEDVSLFKELNMKIIRTILNGNSKEFFKISATTCGKYPIYLVLNALEKLRDENGININAKLLKFKDSSEVYNSFDRVGYASIVFY